MKQIQQYLKQEQVDGWLICDFAGRNPLLSQILGFQVHTSRRVCYWLPFNETPKLLVHSLESAMFPNITGEIYIYHTKDEFIEQLKKFLQNKKHIALEYSPLGELPDVSFVDAGLVDLIRSFGVKIISSANLIARLLSIWNVEQYALHCTAAEKLTRVKDAAFNYIEYQLKENNIINEYTVQQFILKKFSEYSLTSDGSIPIVAVNENTASPHYTPNLQNNRQIHKGDWILIDLWARLTSDNSVYADITWVGVAANKENQKHKHIFDIVCQARDRGIEFLKEHWSQGKSVRGWEVDEEVRKVIKQAGYGKYFTHRTGHSLGFKEAHGIGANLDNFESYDYRLLLPNTGFTIEPGIYLDEFGVRSEINIYLDKTEGVIITTPLQKHPITMDL